MKKRVVSVLLLLSLSVSLMPSALAVGLFSQQEIYVPGQFTDVPEGSPFEENVKTAYELGLMQGQREDYFGASSNLSRLAALIIACRLHSIYSTGADTIEQRYTGETKLAIYQNYAIDNGIFAELPDWSGSVTRSEFAQIISSALPDFALSPINSIADDAIPDVPMDLDGAASIYRLYRAGVLNGRDEFGSFGPELAITRNAACAIASRMASAPLRKTLTLTEETKAAYEAWKAEQEALEAQRLQEAIAQVDTIHVGATVLYDSSLYSNYQLGGKFGTVEAGTDVTYIDYSGTYSAEIVLPDGTSGWVRYSNIRISSDNYVLEHNYTDEQKQGFVNAKGYSSETDYLIWISLSTQQVMVFRGAQGAWELLNSFECCSGKNRTPTIGGVFAIEKKRDWWDFDSYYVNTVVVFNGGHAFHTRTYVKSTGALLDPSMGMPVSQGCIRMYDADVEWISTNMPLGTTVIVY